MDEIDSIVNFFFFIAIIVNVSIVLLYSNDLLKTLKDIKKLISKHKE